MTQPGPAGRAARFRSAFTAFRDTVLTLGAIGGMAHQEVTGHVKPWLLFAYVVILGIAPASHVVALLTHQQPQPLSSSAPGQGTATGPSQPASPA